MLDRITDRSWIDRTDVFFTTDHGELQGDFGLLYKRPVPRRRADARTAHLASLQIASIAPAKITDPVGHLDLAPTFCEIAGGPLPAWIQGKPLPLTSAQRRERVITEWDSQFRQIGMHLRTIYRDSWVCTVYEKSTREVGFDMARIPAVLRGNAPTPDTSYDGTEGELYHLAEDPLQLRNLWNDAAYQKLKSDLIADLYENLPRTRDPLLPVEAPA